MPPVVLTYTPLLTPRRLAPPSPEALTQFLLLCVAIRSLPPAFCCSEMCSILALLKMMCGGKIHSATLVNTTEIAAAQFQHSMKRSRYGVRGGLQTKPTHFNFIQKTFIETISFPTAEFLPMYLLPFIMCSLYYLRPLNFGNMLTLQLKKYLVCLQFLHHLLSNSKMSIP